MFSINRGIKKESEHDIELKETEAKTVKKVLDRIDQVASRYMEGGLTQFNFAIGVLNCFLFFFMFGRYPEHCWLVFLIELSVLYSIRIYDSYHAKPLNTILYYLDYCWIMNAIGIYGLFSIVVDYFTDGVLVDDETRYWMATTFIGVSCGPLLGATLALSFVAVVFHDVTTMASLFIHIIPPMVAYTFLWHDDEIRAAWPGVFKLDYFDRVEFLPQDRLFLVPFTYTGTVAGNTIGLYTLWWILYVSWMMLIGLDLPRKNRTRSDGSVIVPKYDTVFHSTVRGPLTEVIGKVCFGRPASVSKEMVENDDYELRDFFVYMAAHATMFYLSVYLMAYPCYHYRRVHAAWLIFLTIVCVVRGAKRYTYYITAMYGKIVRKDFADLLAAAEKETAASGKK